MKRKLALFVAALAVLVGSLGAGNLPKAAAISTVTIRSAAANENCTNTYQCSVHDKSGTATVKVPSDAHVNDLILIWVVNTTDVTKIEFPTDFITTGGGGSATGNPSSGTIQVTAFYKIAVASDAGKTETFKLENSDNSLHPAWWQVYSEVFTNVNTTNPIDAANSAITTTDATTIAEPAITMTRDGEALAYMWVESATTAGGIEYFPYYNNSCVGNIQWNFGNLGNPFISADSSTSGTIGFRGTVPACTTEKSTWTHSGPWIASEFTINPA